MRRDHVLEDAFNKIMGQSKKIFRKVNCTSPRGRGGVRTLTLLSSYLLCI